MTIQQIIDGVCEALYTAFGDSYTIYTEPVEQNLEEGAFLVRCLNPTKNLDITRRYRRTNAFAIQYIPFSDEPESEIYSVLETMFDCLQDITANGDLIHGNDLDGEIADGILTFTVSYDCFELTEKIETDMGEYALDTELEGE